MVTEFGRIVERLRESVSAHLYRLVVMECGLMAELSHVWEVFTLARYNTHCLLVNMDHVTPEH